MVSPLPLSFDSSRFRLSSFGVLRPAFPSGEDWFGRVRQVLPEGFNLLLVPRFGSSAREFLDRFFGVGVCVFFLEFFLFVESFVRVLISVGVFPH